MLTGYNGVEWQTNNKKIFGDQIQDGGIVAGSSITCSLTQTGLAVKTQSG